jgi:fucose permease
MLMLQKLRIGLGAFCSPLVATQFSQLKRWSFHYLTSLGLACLDAAFVAVAFRFKVQDGESRDSILPYVSSNIEIECLERIGQTAVEKSTSKDSVFRQMFRLKAVHLLSVFAVVYLGLEVTIGGMVYFNYFALVV